MAFAIEYPIGTFDEGIGIYKVLIPKSGFNNFYNVYYKIKYYKGY